MAPFIIPIPFEDRGIFISVGERLAAGDKLYVDVFDNKEPLFYYLIAISRSVGPYADVAVEAMLILICSVSAYTIARGTSSRLSSLVLGCVATPLVLVTPKYLPGYTHLPGIALTLAALAAASRQRFVLAGFITGILAFTKLPMVLLPMLGILGQRAMLPKQVPIWKVIGGGVSSSIPIIALMILRGEFGSFLTVELANVAYANHTAGGSSVLGGLVNHLRRSFAISSIIKILMIITGLMTWLRMGESEGKNLRVVATFSVTTLIASLVVLSLTGLWQHHAQVFNVPAILGLILFAPVCDKLRCISVSSIVGAILVCIAVVLFSSAYFGPGVYKDLQELGALSPETELLSDTFSPGSYARLGQNDDRGHATGLRNWKLACPRFHQYVFESSRTLGAVLDCARTSPVLILAKSLKEVPGAMDYNDFVRSANNLVTKYLCYERDGIRVCRRPG